MKGGFSFQPTEGTINITNINKPAKLIFGRQATCSNPLNHHFVPLMEFSFPNTIPKGVNIMLHRFPVAPISRLN